MPNLFISASAGTANQLTNFLHGAVKYRSVELPDICRPQCCVRKIKFYAVGIRSGFSYLDVVSGACAAGCCHGESRSPFEFQDHGGRMREQNDPRISLEVEGISQPANRLE